MNCRRVQQLLSEFHDGLLTEPWRGGVAAHLRDCHACRRLRDALAQVEGGARALAELPPPPGIESRIADRWIAEREAPPARWLRAPSAAWRSLRDSGGPKAFVPRPREEEHTGNPLRTTVRWAPLSGILAAVFLLALCLILARRDFRLPATSRAAELAQRLGRKPGNPSQRHVPPSPPAEATTQIAAGSQGGSAPRFAWAGRQDPSRQQRVLARSSVTRPRVPVGRAAVSRTATPAGVASTGGDLDAMNGAPAADLRRWAALSPDEWEGLEGRVRGLVRVRDDFVHVPFPRLASTDDRPVAEAVESYRREAAIVDPRLSREVTLQEKGTALSDLCEHLRADTGIQLSAGQSVADEKVSLFCRKMPLRDVMRQLSRPFGYTWLRSGKAGEYRYELVQDLRSQLVEEELRNRDRNAALLALERELEKYRPYLRLTPDEALARSKTAPPEEKKLLENLSSGLGYGPIQMYFRLSPQEMAAIRAGQWIAFNGDPRPDDVLLPRLPGAVFRPGERPLPPDVARGILQCWRQERIRRGPRGLSVVGPGMGPEGPDAVPVASVPEVRPWLTLTLEQAELGQYSLLGHPGLRGPGFGMRGNLWRIGGGRSPKVLQPDNETVNARFAGDPDLRPRLSVQPQPSCRPSPVPGASSDSLPELKITTADVLEILHRATGLPIVADAYTRLYKPERVTVRNQPRFAALNRLADTMRLRWNKEGSWLQFRSTSFYDDRLKEVPNRLLTRWAAARRQHGFLTLEDLVEIAQLSDAQLKGEEMAEGARLCYGLAEWDLARNQWVLPNLRFLGQFTPGQRQEAMTTAGLPFTKMTLAQQQGFLDRAVGSRASGLKEGESLQSLEDLEGATLRVDYTQPGWYEWQPPGPDWLSWVVPLGPPPDGRLVPTPVVRERTREAALQALRGLDAQIREAVWKAVRRADPGNEPNPPTEEAQIVPTKLELRTLYIPGATNKFPVQFQSTGRWQALRAWQ
jgi:hypothetical protein